MGKPVIATRLPGIVREFGEDSGIVYVDGPEDVVTRGAELARNGVLDSLGAKARRFVEGLDWDHIADAFEGALVEAVGRR